MCVNRKLDVITVKLSNQPTHCLINSYNAHTNTHTFSSMLLLASARVFEPAEGHVTHSGVSTPVKGSVHLSGRPKPREGAGHEINPWCLGLRARQIKL